MLSAEQRLIHLKDMMRTTGWSILMEELKEEMEQARADALSTPTWDKLLVQRGWYEAMSQFATMEYLIERMEAEVEDEDASL